MTRECENSICIGWKLNIQFCSVLSENVFRWAIRLSKRAEGPPPTGFLLGIYCVLQLINLGLVFGFKHSIPKCECRMLDLIVHTFASPCTENRDMDSFG